MELEYLLTYTTRDGETISMRCDSKLTALGIALNVSCIHGLQSWTLAARQQRAPSMEGWVIVEGWQQFE